MKVLKPIYGTYSGKLGNIVFNNTKFGNTVRSLGFSKRLKTETQFKNAAKRRAAVNLWRTLSFTQQMQWGNYANEFYQAPSYKRTGVATGYNVHTAFFGLQQITQELVIPGTFRNLTTDTEMMSDPFIPVYNQSPPTVGYEGSFEDVNSGLPMWFSNQRMDFSDPADAKMNFTIQSNATGILLNNTMPDLNGYKHVWVVYCSGVLNNPPKNMYRLYDYHICTLFRLSEIYNTYANNSFQYSFPKVTFETMFRNKIQGRGYFTSYVVDIDENGACRAGYPTLHHTDEIETI